MGKLDAGHARDWEAEDLTAEGTSINPLWKAVVLTRPLEGQKLQVVKDIHYASWSFCRVRTLREEVSRKWRNVKDPDRGEKGALGQMENTQASSWAEDVVWSRSVG